MHCNILIQYKPTKRTYPKLIFQLFYVDTNRLPKQALKYKPKGRRNIGRPRKRWRDQPHLEDQGTGNTPNPSRNIMMMTMNCFCLLRVSNPKTHLQEEHTLLPTRLLIMMHVKRTTSELYINVFLKMNSRIRNM